MTKTKIFLFAASALLLFYGCGEKAAELQYNQSAEFWYNEMIKTIATGDMEKADSLYTSLSSEHVASPILSEALLILAQAHMDESEYVEANKYLDEYIKRFGSASKNEYARYLKVRANYASFTRPNRNQQLMSDTIYDTGRFIDEYPNSAYVPFVESVLVYMELGKYLIEENIISLYNKLDKSGASEFYREKSENYYMEDGEFIRPSVPWYRKWFEW